MMKLACVRIWRVFEGDGPVSWRRMNGLYSCCSRYEDLGSKEGRWKLWKVKLAFAGDGWSMVGEGLV